MVENISILDLLSNILLTCVIYEFVPFILKFVLKKQYMKKEARNVAIINSIIIYILFLLYYEIILQNDKIPNMIASYFWGCISYYLLSKKDKSEGNYIMDDDIKSRDKQRKKQNLPQLADTLAIIIILSLGILNIYTYLNFNEQYARLELQNENLIIENNNLKEICKNYAIESMK